MAKHIFISDTHLEPEQAPRTWQLFFRFLEKAAREKSRLYILGDLVDYWVNNGRMEKKYRPLFESLARVAKQGGVCLIRGNRDFLFRKSFLKQWGIRLLPDCATLEVTGRTLLLSHGDNFWSVQPYRRYKKYGWPLIRFLDYIYIIPPPLGNYAARRMREKSQKTNRNIPDNAQVFNKELIGEYFRRGVDTVICGHIHKSSITHCPGGKEFVVLPAWREERGGYCILEEGKVRLEAFSG